MTPVFTVARRISASALALLAAIAVACAPTRGANAPASSAAAANAIGAQLERYRAAVMTMDYDAIASVFTADAALSHETQAPIIGRDSIRKFLMSFAAYRVTAYQLVADSQTVNGAAARADGHYAQTVRVPDGSTVSVAGTFTTQWHREPDGIWLITSLHTASPAR